MTTLLLTAPNVCITTQNLNTYQRSLWVLIIVLGNLIGWILYWAIGRKGEKQTS
ncbi:PLDc N-terminal domain-containing protein [Sphingobacterium allocomposti]|uniref:PLDc N-terminal domain-containing protein n=1 Tax=Sphingobacterium allocomposti TaxID=415956 RepID=UPI0011E86AA3